MSPQAKARTEDTTRWMGRAGLFIIGISVPIFFNQVVDGFNEIRTDVKTLLQNDVTLKVKVDNLEKQVQENKGHIDKLRDERTVKK